MTSPGWVTFGDWVRVLIFALSAVQLGTIGRVLFMRRDTGMSRWQTARFVALALATVSIFFTEMGRLHTEVTWRLPVNLGALVAGCYGVWGLAMRPRDTPFHEMEGSG